jgi:hypothetical protein
MKTKDQQKAARDRLAELEEQHGKLTANLVVADAEKRDSPLHNYFEWDTRKAAQRYRLMQARALIRSVRINVRTEKTVVSTVAYIRDPAAGPREQGYLSVAKVRTDKDVARDALVDEFSRAAAILRRAREIAVAFDMAGEVDTVVTEVETLRTRVVATTVDNRQAA